MARRALGTLAAAGTLVITLLLCSCASAYRPKSPVPVTVFTNPYLVDLASPNLIAVYDAIPDGPAKVARRNAILYELQYLTDQSYDAYEANFFAGQSYVGTAGDIAVMALNGVAAVTGTAHFKAILSAISGGVTGARATYQKNFFDAATRESIVQVMRANRARTLAEIEAGMATCSTATSCPTTGTTYTLEQGLTDEAAYFDAGTVIGALVAVNNNSTLTSMAAREAIRKLKGLHD